MEAAPGLSVEEEQQMEEAINNFLRGDDSQMDKVFNILDYDGNGKIDMAEFKNRFFKSTEQPQQEMLLKIFDKIDANNDGIVDKQELMTELRSWRDG